MSETAPLSIGIVCGGRSGEHEVSLRSAVGIYRALDRRRFAPLLLGIDRAGGWHAGPVEALLLNPDDPARVALEPSAPAVVLTAEDGVGVVRERGSAREVARVDVAFPIVHGTDGEDGALQGHLRVLGLPFVGSDVLGSAIGMDKGVVKRLLSQAGLPVASWVELRDPAAPERRWARLVERLGSPLFVKPAGLGSSVGVSRVEGAGAFADAVAEAFRYDRKVLVEEAVAGREIECSVLGNRGSTRWPPQASLPGEVVPRRDFYSYAAKYLDAEGADLHAPADLDAAIVRNVQATALQAFDVLEAEGLARVDLFLRGDGSLVVNEINTLPGFTPISMYPKLWEVSGVAYPDLLARLIDLARERHRQREALQRRFDLPGS